ncbi:hypothetical protein SADUNF_Sadunf18G0042700 [Salix dunnii]|uniref:Uncharacterized protein n=1 Tax=Salix dunnii TaxID=1413687 RepID=A0A835J378_9ROSI|nr:hypothetical protein SADUNF_Sadunf18G0042700 [Salix dunnii]
MNSHIVSPSQECSSKGFSLPSHGVPEGSGILMDSEFRLPGDFFNGLPFQGELSKRSGCQLLPIFC